MAEEAVCPKCGSEYEVEKHGFYRCEECQTYFYFPAGYWLCPFCHGEISKSAPKCKHCGEWINKNAAKSRSTYLLLTFLFGNLGVGEFYAGENVGGAILLILSFLAIRLDWNAAIGTLFFLWLVAFWSAWRSDVGLQGTEIKKHAKVRKIVDICILYPVFFALIAVLIIAAFHWKKFL